MNIAKAGTLLCIERGEYSEYEVVGFFVVLKEFAPQTELESYLADNPEEKARYSFDRSRFLARLLAKGLLLEICYGALYLGNYGGHEEFRFTPVLNK